MEPRLLYVEVSITTLTVDELRASAMAFGLADLDPGLWRGIRDRMSDRIESGLEKGVSAAIRLGMFSYLQELTTAWPSDGPLAEAFAGQVAIDFQARNSTPEHEMITAPTIKHFAQVIRNNHYDWDGLLVAFLDPEAARIDWLRQNLKLTPSERLRRHQVLMPQLRRARRV